jgi:hypothetical protein
MVQINNEIKISNKCHVFAVVEIGSTPLPSNQHRQSICLPHRKEKGYERGKGRIAPSLAVLL